jgi:hypothetical protein
MAEKSACVEGSNFRAPSSSRALLTGSERTSQAKGAATRAWWSTALMLYRMEK